MTITHEAPNADPAEFLIVYAAMIASEEADAAALEAVENLLESYFVQVDSTFDKLEAIGVRASSRRGSKHR